MDNAQTQMEAYLNSLSLWDSAPAAFFVARPIDVYDFEWLYANAALDAHFDRSTGAVQGTSFRALFPAGSASWAKLVEATARTGEECSTTQYSTVLQKTLVCKAYCPLPGLCAGFVQDVSARVHLAQKTAATQKRLNLILQNTTDLVFDFDLDTHTLYPSAEAVERYGALPAYSNAPQSMLEAGLLCEAGASAFSAAIAAIAAGAAEQMLELELRFCATQGNAMLWHAMKLLRCNDALTQRLCVIGYVRDIDRQRRQTDTLRAAAERDSLTGLYNRSAAEQRALPALLAPKPFAFFVFDVDNFKQINDLQGHAHGDAMLMSFAQTLRDSFRHDEVVWRHGGDEFCACVFGVSARTVLEKRCAQVLQQFAHAGRHGARRAASDAIAAEKPSAAQTTTAQPTPVAPFAHGAQQTNAHSAAAVQSIQAITAQVSCSIGVAYGTGPQEYSACFAAADAALFQTKARGKNGFTVVEL